MLSFRRLPRLAALLAFAVVLSVAGSASAAVGSVHIAATAQLVARGAAADIKLTATLTCDEGFDFGIVEANVTQAHKGRLAKAFGQTRFACDGTPQTVILRASPGEIPFHTGPALVDADLLQCQSVSGGGGICEFTGIETSEVTRIRR